MGGLGGEELTDGDNADDIIDVEQLAHALVAAGEKKTYYSLYIRTT